MDNSRKTIIYTGNFNLGNMNAAGKRVLANGKLLNLCGYNVIFVSGEVSNHKSEEIRDTHQLLYGFDVYSFPSCLKSRWHYSQYYKKFVGFIENIQKDNKVVAIITYGSPSLALLEQKLVTYAHKQNITIIADVVDWLKVDSGNVLFRIVKQLDTNYRNAFVNKKMDGIIAISSFLKGYYCKAGLKSIIIPPLEWSRGSHCDNENNATQIIYAGIPFRIGARIKDPHLMKDRFDLVVKYLAEVKKLGIKFSFHVYGFTKEELLMSCPELKEYVHVLSDSVFFYGNRKMEEIKEAMRSKDYSIFLREKVRATMAGFPTKVSESISCSVPVITTKTSDIEKYLSEGNGAYYIDITNYNAAIKKLAALLSIDSNTRLKQTQNCGSIHIFEIESYINETKAFFDSFII